MRRLGWVGVWAVVLGSIVLLAAAPDTRVVEAARQRDSRTVAALLKAKVDPNVPQPDGATALHWAAHWDDLPLAKALIAAGARVNATNDYGAMPLNLAATNGSAAMVETLLSAGANMNAALPTGETVLMTAARTGRLDAVRVLLSRGADVNARQTSKGQNALMWAVSERHVDVARALLDKGADVHAATAAGFTPILFAAREGSLPVVQLLLERGADLNASDAEGATPLLVATVRGHVALASFLIEKGAQPDGNATGAGYTPLHWAATRSEGVITNDYPDAPGEWAALAGIPNRADKLALIRLLIAKGAQVNARVTKDLPRYGFSLFKRNYLPGGTPFYLAALVGDTEVMRLLLAHGADPKVTARDNTTPLMVAAGIAHADNESRVSEADHLAAVKMTLELGNDLNATNGGGFTALHAASYAGFDAVVQFLAGKGAALNAVAKNGQSALGIAEGNNLSGFFFERRSTAALLRTLGAKSEGAVTLEGFIKKQVGNQSATKREFDAGDAKPADPKN